jgi:hypothetical protein
MKDNDGDNHAKSTLYIDHVALDVKEVTEISTLEGDVSREKKEGQPGGTAQRRSSDPFDDSLLHRAVADGGRWAYGVMFVEVWVQNEITQFFRPESGWWIDPVFHSDCGENCKICRLTNPKRKDFLKPEPLFPGEGLPGVLCVQIDTAASTDAVAWREIKTVAGDPDQPWNPRLQQLAEIGLGWAAAVPFNCHGQKGIVVYMAKASVSMTRFQSSSNELYLQAASSLIGAAYALRQPRLQMQNDRTQFASVMRRVRRKIIMAHRLGINLKDDRLKDDTKENVWLSESSSFRSILESKRFEHCKKGVEFVGKKVTTVVIKSKGAGRQPPPATNWEQSAYTFIGCFITLLMLCRLNVYLFDEHGSDFTIVLGYVHVLMLHFACARSTNMISFISPFLFPLGSPFGALVTLLYGLTSAPASQPRSAIAGQTIAMTISLAVSYADNMSIWMRQALATSLAVAAMAKMGVTHPPAGAAALLFASGSFGWGNMLFVLVGNVIAIGAATLINNFSEYRQYPTFWSFHYTFDCIRGYDRGKTD